MSSSDQRNEFMVDEDIRQNIGSKIESVRRQMLLGQSLTEEAAVMNPLTMAHKVYLKRKEPNVAPTTHAKTLSSNLSAPSDSGSLFLLASCVNSRLNSRLNSLHRGFHMITCRSACLSNRIGWLKNTPRKLVLKSFQDCGK